MNGNHTDLETSKRLAKVWSGPPLNTERWWWFPEEKTFHPDEVEWDCGESEWILDAEWPEGGPIPARDLSELEAKIEEMGLEWHATSRVGTVWTTMWEKEGENMVAQGKAEHFIDALGAAVAEALEKAGEGGKKA